MSETIEANPGTDAGALSLPVADGLEPFAQGRGWVIYNADVLDLVPRLPDGCVDVVLVDPPYCSGGMFRADRQASTTRKYVQTQSVGARQNLVGFLGDQMDQRVWMRWVHSWMRLSLHAQRRGGYLVSFIDWRQLPAMTDSMQGAGLVWRGTAVWDKTQGCRPNPGYFRQQCEYLPWGTVGDLADAKKRPVLPGCFRYAPLSGGVKLHQAGKPEPLMADLVRVALPGELIADWFAGSGTTGVAAIRAGRRFIGADIGPHWCRVAADRLRAAEAEPR
jgi:site-specific DNA-methyltransferase (adenine-specific)